MPNQIDLEHEHERVRSWGRRDAKNVRHTFQGFEVRCSFGGGTFAINSHVVPVPPDRDVLEVRIETAVLHILGREDSGASTGVDKVIESNCTIARRVRSTG